MNTGHRENTWKCLNFQCSHSGTASVHSAGKLPFFTYDAGHFNFTYETHEFQPPASGLVCSACTAETESIGGATSFQQDRTFAESSLTVQYESGICTGERNERSRFQQYVKLAEQGNFLHRG
jgi:hypothetical protein